MKQVIKIGIVGAGEHAFQSHIQPIIKLDNVKLEAVCDMREERLSDLQGSGLSFTPYTDYQKMLENKIVGGFFGPLWIVVRRLIISAGRGQKRR